MNASNWTHARRKNLNNLYTINNQHSVQTVSITVTSHQFQHKYVSTFFTLYIHFLVHCQYKPWISNFNKPLKHWTSTPFFQHMEGTVTTESEDTDSTTEIESLIFNIPSGMSDHGNKNSSGTSVWRSCLANRSGNWPFHSVNGTLCELLREVREEQSKRRDEEIASATRRRQAVAVGLTLGTQDSHPKTDTNNA